MNKPTIFIDESGTLPDPKDRVIVIAAVGAEDLTGLSQTFRSIRKRRGIKEKHLELKFYKAGIKTKNLFFEKLSKQPVSIFVLVVDKMGRKIPDTPEHFAVLCGLVISEILHFYSGIQKIAFDRHFHKNHDENAFNKALKEFLGIQSLPLEHLDSQTNMMVNVADMIAGALLSKESGKNTSFYEMIKDQIVSETRLNWPEAKRRWVEQKNLPEPVQAPIQGKN